MASLGKIERMDNKVLSSDGGLGLIDSLREDKTKVADLRLIRRALRNGWDIPERMIRNLPEIMAEIVEQKTTTVLDAEGNQVEISNARNQVAAAKTILEADRLNQTDFWNQDKNDRLDAGKLTENTGVVPVVLRAPCEPIDEEPSK